MLGVGFERGVCALGVVVFDCNAPLKVGQEPVMFRRLVDGVGCIG